MPFLQKQMNSKNSFSILFLSLNIVDRVHETSTAPERVVLSHNKTKLLLEQKKGGKTNKEQKPNDFSRSSSYPTDFLLLFYPRDSVMNEIRWFYEVLFLTECMKQIRVLLSKFYLFLFFSKRNNFHSVRGRVPPSDKTF